MHRTRLSPRTCVVLLAALVVVAGAWLPSWHVAHAEGPEPTKIRVEITDNGFNGKTDLVVDVPQGQVVEITFVFAQTIDRDDTHVIALKGYGLETDEISFYNPESTLKFVADKPGTFEFACELDCKIHDKLKSAHLKIGGSGSASGSTSGAGGSSASSSIGATSLSLTPSTWNVTTGAVILTASLKDAKGAAVPKADVAFFVEADFAGTKGLRVIGEARTDKEGTAQLAYQPTVSGEQHFVARFEGMGLYGESEQAVQVAVSGDLPNYVIAPAGLDALRQRAPFVLGLVVLAVWSAYGFVVYQAYRIARNGSLKAAEPQKEG